MRTVNFVLICFLVQGAEPQAKPTSEPTTKPTVQTSVPRDSSKSRNLRQRADEAYRYNTNDDLKHSIEQ